jgi:hypothetical protein
MYMDLLSAFSQLPLRFVSAAAATMELAYCGCVHNSKLYTDAERRYNGGWERMRRNCQ